MDGPVQEYNKLIEKSQHITRLHATSSRLQRLLLKSQMTVFLTKCVLLRGPHCAPVPFSQMTVFPTKCVLLQGPQNNNKGFIVSDVVGTLVKLHTKIH